ncbi:hypothetical protein B0I35DRAFT_440830 [Stachybotrys elegans]|uniref:Uncharacterized protein n=1 Tax=Stachybotrys elegans TaxID=80388 RepID=A0A8K0WM35_9HYPO|nr:hypothetical protein B0I35DRAFT_440830 [Stachybotrys elegans]
MQFKNFLVILAAITGASATCTGTSSCEKTCSCTCPGTTLATNGEPGCSLGSVGGQGISCPSGSGTTTSTVACDQPCPDCNCPNTPTCRNPTQGCQNTISRCNVQCTC